MSWLAATFTKYPELAVFLAVGVGYWAGAFKVRGIGLGPVTCSLLVGCLIGYFFKVPVSSTAKSILLLLFLFSIANSVGPKFAVTMMLTATLTAPMLTTGGRSVWFVGGLALTVYLIFAKTRYVLPPAAG